MLLKDQSSWLILLLVPWEENRLRVPTKLTAWPKNRKERISVSNFGIGGTNAHVSNIVPYISYIEDVVADQTVGNR